jgi:hypothetical protein
MMPLQKDPSNDCFIGADGCHYETEWEARHIGQLGMCGCGQPEEAYNFLRQVLSICDRRGCHDNPPTKEWVMIEPEIAKLIAAKPDTVAHVLLHFLTDKDVLEHGGSVGGSWLTPAGEEIVDSPPAPADED